MNNSMIKRYSILIATSLIAAAVHLGVNAEEIAVPAGAQGDSNVVTPNTGTTKDNVARHFGQPGQASGAVGEPPISRWEYGQFFVYFEHDRVIHSVLKK